MVWSGTSKVGCAIGSCPKQGFPYGVAVVCQYSPQGNIITLDNYKSGKTCSACQGACALVGIQITSKLIRKKCSKVEFSVCMHSQI